MAIHDSKPSLLRNRTRQVLSYLRRKLIGRSPLYLGDFVFVNGKKILLSQYRNMQGDINPAFLAQHNLLKAEEKNSKKFSNAALDFFKNIINLTILAKFIPNNLFSTLFANVCIFFTAAVWLVELRRYYKLPENERNKLRFAIETLKTILLLIGGLGAVIAPILFATAAPMLFVAALLVVAVSEFFQAYKHYKAANVPGISPAEKEKHLKKFREAFKNGVTATAVIAVIVGIGMAVLLGGLPIVAAAVIVVSLMLAKFIVDLVGAYRERNDIKKNKENNENSISQQPLLHQENANSSPSHSRKKRFMTTLTDSSSLSQETSRSRASSEGSTTEIFDKLMMHADAAPKSPKEPAEPSRISENDSDTAPLLVTNKTEPISSNMPSTEKSIDDTKNTEPHPDQRRLTR